MRGVYYSACSLCYKTIAQFHQKCLLMRDCFTIQAFTITRVHCTTCSYMLNSKHLSLVNKIGDKTEFTITRVHCTYKIHTLEVQKVLTAPLSDILPMAFGLHSWNKVLIGNWRIVGVNIARWRYVFLGVWRWSTVTMEYRHG